MSSGQAREENDGLLLKYSDVFIDRQGTVKTLSGAFMEMCFCWNAGIFPNRKQSPLFRQLCVSRQQQAAF